MDVRKQMKIQSVTETPEEITIVTTGAKYVFDKSAQKGRILCYQELNEKRLLATIELNHPLASLSIEHQDETTCVLHQKLVGSYFLRVQVNSDSVLDLHCFGQLHLVFSGSFLPDYCAEKAGNVLLIDESGGIGIYPCRSLRSAELTNSTSPAWRADYVLDEWSRLLVSVFPPRPFDYQRSLEDRIAHHAVVLSPPPPAHPSAEMLEEASKYANILVLHELIWQGKLTREGQPVTNLDERYENAAYCCYDYVPVDEEVLTGVIGKAHALGMKVIPYMSPTFALAKGNAFLDRMECAIAAYDFDGVYFDGLAYDVLEAYELIREARARMGEKLIYYHCTPDPLWSVKGYVYCPFINTYADYVLRGEYVHESDDKYLRYVVSGFNTSNTINFICHYDYPLELMRQLIDRALAVKARFYLGTPETEREVLLKEEYFPKLDEEYRRFTTS